MKRIELIADEGMVYTNGEMYGAIIYPAEGLDINTFYQIPIEEYRRIINEQEQDEPF